MSKTNQDNSASIPNRNIRGLAIETYKIVDDISPKIIKEDFKLREESHHDLRHISQFTIPCVNSVYHGTESLSFLGPKIW